MSNYFSVNDNQSSFMVEIDKNWHIKEKEKFYKYSSYVFNDNLKKETVISTKKPLIENLAIYKMLEEGKIELFSVKYSENSIYTYTFAAAKDLGVKIGDYVLVDSTTCDYEKVVKVVDKAEINIDLQVKYRFINSVVKIDDKKQIVEDYNKVVEDLKRQVERNKAKKAFEDAGLTLEGK